MISYSMPAHQRRLRSPTTPYLQRLMAITQARFSLIRFRSPLLTESRLLSLPVGTEMFHFPTFPPLALYIQTRVTGLASSRVSPFGNPRITVWLSTPRGLSQIPTSFFGSWYQGIHRVPLKTWLHTIQDARVHCVVLNIRAVPVPDRAPPPTHPHRAPRAPRRPDEAVRLTGPVQPVVSGLRSHSQHTPTRRPAACCPIPQDPTTCQAPTAPRPLSTTPHPEKPGEELVLTTRDARRQLIDVPPLSTHREAFVHGQALDRHAYAPPASAP